MRWLGIFALITALILVPSARAQVPPSAKPYNYTPLTPTQNNISIATASSLTVPAGATYAVVQSSGGNAYYTYDGSTPTTSNYSGYLTAGQTIGLSGVAVISAFKIVGTSMAVSYFK